jgi:hypothetical protein
MDVTTNDDFDDLAKLSAEEIEELYQRQRVRVALAEMAAEVSRLETRCHEEFVRSICNEQVARRRRAFR